MDERVPFSEIQAAFGLVAHVTRPDDEAATETTVVWSSAIPELSPSGMVFQGSSAKKVMSLAKADLTSVPDGTVIEAPEEEGGEAKTWRVDGEERAEYDHWRVMVVESNE